MSLLDSTKMPVSYPFIEQKDISRTTVKSIIGEEMKCKDSVVGFVTLGEITTKQRFIRVENVYVGAVLGMDFFSKFDSVQFNISKKCVVITRGGKRLRFNLSTKRLKEKDNRLLFIKDMCTILPNTRKIIPVTTYENVG